MNVGKNRKDEPIKGKKDGIKKTIERKDKLRGEEAKVRWTCWEAIIHCLL